ncbi:cyclic nucleotide-binding domain-containing protein [uncultured Piscinibacter sp.]|uniref:cyclic nucleotide-binding domain-containing protein n=1 Tax=uncultured Piscinibacter sp. TaxID=1131835 RepID=UPI00262A8A93|nr:cyclic nucleotide-binding domain-containing protein [uncultured Piscinibacter sp.]
MTEAECEAPRAAPSDLATVMAMLGRSTLFQRCSNEDLAALAGSARHVDHAAGTDIVCEGDPAHDLMLIESGEALVLKRGDSGQEHTINRLVAGDSFGEMALFDRVPRSATVRAAGPVRTLVLPLQAIVALAEARPTLVPVLVDIGALVAERLRASSNSAVAAADRALAEERMRAVMGRFTLLLIMAYTLYTWVLGTAAQMKVALGHSEFITVPAIIVCVAILIAFVRVSGYPASFFGLTWQNAGRHIREAVLLTLPLMALTVLLKLALLKWVPGMEGLSLFQMFAPAPANAPAGGFNPWLALAYVVFAPFQELIYRGGVQGSLSHFLTGRRRDTLAIVGANIIFSAAHLYVSVGLAVTAFAAGLFWGWLYARQRGLAGVSVSHVLLGFWAFEVVDLGVLE